MPSLPTTFEEAYGFDPWQGLNMNTMPFYSPILLEIYRQENVYNQFTPTKVQIQETTELNFDMMFDLEPNINPIGFRDMWLESMRSDSQRFGIKTQRFGGKTALWKYDSYINRWKKQGKAGLDAIVRDLLARSVVDVLDQLNRNAHANLPFRTFAMGGATSFNDLVAADTYNWRWAQEARLQAHTMNLPGFSTNYPGSGNIVAITSPGAIYDMENDAEALKIFQYTGPERVYNHEYASLMRATYVQSPRNILWNAGPITHQFKVIAPIKAGDGGADWTTYKVGQDGATKYITLDATAGPGDIKINDIVTIHVKRGDATGKITSGFVTGVADCVDWQDGMTFQRVVKYVSADGQRIGFERPMMWDFDVDLKEEGGLTSFYAYVTKGLNVHMTVYMFGPGAIAMGVTQEIQMHIPPTVDDTMGLSRFTWDGYFGYSTFRPELAEVVFHTGHHRLGGNASVGGD